MTVEIALQHERRLAERELRREKTTTCQDAVWQIDDAIASVQARLVAQQAVWIDEAAEMLRLVAQELRAIRLILQPDREAERARIVCPSCGKTVQRLVITKHCGIVCEKCAEEQLCGEITYRASGESVPSNPTLEREGWHWDSAVQAWVCETESAESERARIAAELRRKLAEQE